MTDTEISTGFELKLKPQFKSERARDKAAL